VALVSVTSVYSGSLSAERTLRRRELRKERIVGTEQETLRPQLITKSTNRRSGLPTGLEQEIGEFQSGFKRRFRMVPAGMPANKCHCGKAPDKIEQALLPRRILRAINWEVACVQVDGKMGSIGSRSISIIALSFGE